MLIGLDESESSQNQSEQSSTKQSTNHPKTLVIDAPAWTPALAQRYLEESYDVEYSIPSCRRLLKETRLSYQKPRRTAAESDAEE